jgi:endonuclease/exonuclease/phosphatase family metal-dependent hydrolase
LAFVLLCATACGPPRVETIPAESLRCIDLSDTRVTWDRPAVNRRSLDRWCASVGPPVVIASAASPGKQINRLVVISWNVHVGGGRLQELADLIRARTAELGGEVGVVLLLQEVFRGGEAVGALVPGGLRVPAAIRPHRPADDVVQVAAKLGMSAFYVPSMRNGRSISLYEQEDRGSAILSTEPLSDLKAIELPFARQRRVAVMATVTPRNAGAGSMQLVTGHFDVAMLGRGGSRQAEHLAGRLPGLNGKRLPVIVGVDANAMRGFKDGTVKALARVVPLLKRCGTGRTAAWLARLDFVFSDLPDAAVDHCETLHERYGSDHRPILLRIDYE